MHLNASFSKQGCQTNKQRQDETTMTNHATNKNDYNYGSSMSYHI